MTLQSKCTSLEEKKMNVYTYIFSTLCILTRESLASKHDDIYYLISDLFKITLNYFIEDDGTKRFYLN